MICLKCKGPITSGEIYGLHNVCFRKWFHTEDSLEFIDIDPKSSSSDKTHSPQIMKKKNTFFHGQYLKYSARLGVTEYILKVQEDKYPELPATEYLCNEIATLLNVEVPPFHLIKFNDRITFVTRNFMQDYPGGTLHHLYKFLPEGDDFYNCEKIIDVITNQTGRLSDVAKFIEICLFDAFVGNNDRHGRNIGVIETAKLKKLAPMYDNPSFLGIESDFMLGAHFNPSGSIWTSNTKEPKPTDYLNEFKRLGHQKITTQFIKRLISNYKKITEAVSGSGLHPKRKQAFLKLIEVRIGEFENAK